MRVVPATTGTIDVEIKALGHGHAVQHGHGPQPARRRADACAVHRRTARRAGELLAEIDPRPFQSQLNQAQGQHQENRARLKNAEGDLDRYQKLVTEGLITKQQVTTQEALVQQYKGALQANDAQVANARLQLAYTRIVAPIDGRLGLRQVDAGNLIRAGDANGLVVITQMRPISVIFTVPEAELPAVLDAYRRGNAAAGRGVGSVGGGDAGHGHAADDGQPDRHDHRHASSCARSSPTPTRSCSRTSS